MPESITPVRKQYLEIKRDYPNAIVFFRLGDFYETFDGDAETVARELEIVLTSRNMAKGVRVPMAGIPHHAAEAYLARLIGRGYHVAICEQIGDTPVGGLFPRQVVRVVTPGTVLEPGLLPGDAHNYLAAAFQQGDSAAVAFVDVSTGEFHAAQVEGEAASGFLRHELARLAPGELLIPEEAAGSGGFDGHVTPIPSWKFDPARGMELLLSQFRAATLEGFGLGEKPLATGCAGAILDYLKTTQPVALELLTGLATYSAADFMTLDAATRRNLELTRSLRQGSEQGSLLAVVDSTRTPLGRRLLRQWIGQPLTDRLRIEGRLEQVAAFYDDGMWRGEVREALQGFPDLERLVNRIVGGLAQPRELLVLGESLQAVSRLTRHLAGRTPALADLERALDPCPDTIDLVAHSLADDPPATLAQPGVIRAGFDAALDRIVEAAREARDWIAGLEAKERQRTGIKSLKVGFNKIFGYYLEVTRANTDQVPDEYLRKQTLVNAERYITPEMKEVEVQGVVGRGTDPGSGS